MGFIIIYVTHEYLESARKLTTHLLNKKLIACANFMPIEACYWWKGSITESKEYVSLLKTRTNNWNIVKEEIEKNHPYEVPCIMKIDVEANKSYEAWIEEETENK